MEWGLDPVTEYGFLHWAIPSCGEGCSDDRWGRSGCGDVTVGVLETLGGPQSR